MKNSVYILLFFIVWVNLIYSQSYFSKDFDFHGSGGHDRISVSVIDNDTMYLVVTEDCGADFCNRFVVMDSLGNIISEKLYTDIRMNPRNGMIKENDELIILDGKCCNDSAYFHLLFLDHLNLEVKRSFKYFPEEQMIFMAEAAVESFGNYYILMGWSQQNDDTWPEQMMWINKQTMEVDSVLKFTSTEAVGVWNNGHVQGDRFYASYDLNDPVLNEIRGFIGWDQEMNQVFNYEIQTLNQSNIFQNSTIALSNGNLVYETLEKDDRKFLDISSIDKSGNIVWSNKEIRSDNSSFGNKIWNFSETSSGDILACGIGTWFLGYQGDYPPILTPELIEARYDAAYILKLDGVTGEILWNYNLVEFTPDGKVRKTDLRGIHELSDGSIICTGHVRHKDENGLYQNYDSWIVRLPEDGCRPEYECANESFTSSVNEITDFEENHRFIIYPNPSTNGSYSLSIDMEVNQKIALVVYNTYGVKVLERAINSNYLDFSLGNNSGIYYYHIISRDSKILKHGKLLSF